jgi:hypothetical protein
MELMTRRWEIIQGTRPDTPEEHAQISEGFKCLTEMEIWYRDKRAKSALNALEFDHLGHPITGQHSRKINSTTSGANES